MHPIVIVNLRKIIDSGATDEQIFKAKFFLDGYLNYLAMVPGRIEQFVHIFDVTDIGVWEIPVETAKMFISRSIGTYPQCAGLGVFVNMN